MCVEAALSKSGGGIHLFEACTELARASGMVVAAVERQLRVAMVSAWRMSAGGSGHGGSRCRPKEVLRGEARTSASCLVLTVGGGVTVGKAPAAVVGELGSPGGL
jgi:hypothetical protein